MKWTLGVVVLLALAGCAETFEPDIAAMATEIENGIEDKAGIQVDVTCPDVEWEAGDDFRCQAESDDYATTLVTVYMQTADGEWAWEVAG